MASSPTLAKVRNNPHLSWALDYDWPIATYMVDYDNLFSLRLTKKVPAREIGYVLNLANTAVTDYMLAHPGALEAAYPVAQQKDRVDLLYRSSRLVEECRAASSDLQFGLCHQWLQQIEHASCDQPAHIRVTTVLLQCCSLQAPQALRQAWLLHAMDYSLTYAALNDIHESDVDQECQYLRDELVTSDAAFHPLRGLWCALVAGNAGMSARKKATLLCSGLAQIAAPTHHSEAPEELLAAYCPVALPHWPVIQELGLSLAQAYQLITPTPVVYAALPEQLSV